LGFVSPSHKIRQVRIVVLRGFKKAQGGVTKWDCSVNVRAGNRPIVIARVEMIYRGRSRREINKRRSGTHLIQVRDINASSQGVNQKKSNERRS
jgi:hypothetical protein